MTLTMLVNIVVPVSGLIALAFVAILFLWINRQDTGSSRMCEIASYIQEGANAFLRRECATIAPFVAVLAAILWITMGKWQIVFGFVMGALFSMVAVFIGMNAAVQANVRTTQAARSSPANALTIAFRGGGTMGLTIVALNLLGVSLLFVLFGITSENAAETVHLLVGFGFGASLSSLFAQLGGGIYTKAADVGADLVGKVEIGIPEDDPRNAAVIADLVGDNVGDCAGRGADLFESGADNLIATMIVGTVFMSQYGNYGWMAVLFPLISRAIGAIGAILGIMAVKGSEKRSPIAAVNIGLAVTGIFSLISFWILGVVVMQSYPIFWSLALGLVAAILVSLIIQYYTGINQKPVLEIARASLSGSALNIMSGFSYGLESVSLPIVTIGAVTLAAYLIGGGWIGGVFALTAATLGITEMKGIIMAADAFGPIADNASGIAEMAGLGSEVRRAGDALDAAGNITKAITKGYGMACALMTSVVVMFAYLVEAAKQTGVDLTNMQNIPVIITDPMNIVAMMIGAAVPFVFSALTIRAVGVTAYQVVGEVRRQFREIPGLLEGEVRPEYTRCVDITTRNALRHMMLPIVVGTIVPIVVGFVLGVWALAAYLVAVKIVGALLATFMFNAGGAWDNAKKYVEEGHYGGKGSEAHRAAVTGDTFGDPLKDTAGPSLHILIKLQNILAITLLPLFVTYGAKW
ncbi:MAG: sodium-translocating pyrophosphatase [Chloroflexota bacterium]|nr:sodium-translocating pyrophosphatase [Chloroflexota bacterium]